MEQKSEPLDLLRAARAAGRKVAAIRQRVTGLSTLLLGLKEYTDNITAIVTVTDDGGGSGVLRDEYGMLPPGDIRNCLLALANTSDAMNELLNYRFPDGSLKGQSFGNLFLLALNGVCGSFQTAVARMNDFLAVTGQVLPVTTSNVHLRAQFEDGSQVEGETAITRAKKRNNLVIQKIWLEPAGAQALPEVIQAIDEADLDHIGAGQPVHQRDPQPVGGWGGPGHPPFQRVKDLHSQHHDPRRRDRGLYGGRPPGGAAGPRRRPGPGGCVPLQHGPGSTPPAGTVCGRKRPAAVARPGGL